MKKLCFSIRLLKIKNYESICTKMIVWNRKADIYIFEIWKKTRRIVVNVQAKDNEKKRKIGTKQS